MEGANTRTSINTLLETTRNLDLKNNYLNKSSNYKNDGDYIKNLILSLISLIVFKKYSIAANDDDNKYMRDDIEFKNKSNEILKNINSIKLQHKRELSDVKEYKTKYNLDNINYAEVNNKILSKKYDDYEYNNKPNFINFIVDIFKPTKK
jgi:hypothetical protein